jgi:hypothetical protein
VAGLSSAFYLQRLRQSLLPIVVGFDLQVSRHQARLQRQVATLQATSLHQGLEQVAVGKPKAQLFQSFLLHALRSEGLGSQARLGDR